MSLAFRGEILDMDLKLACLDSGTLGCTSGGNTLRGETAPAQTPYQKTVVSELLSGKD